MQSKSPFKKVDIFDGRASSYRNPSTVIQPIVGAIVGKQIAKTASELGTKAITTSMNKDQRAAEAAAGDLKHQRALELASVKYGKPQKETTPDIYTKAEYDRDQFMNTDYSGGGKSKGFDLVKIGREGNGTRGIKPQASTLLPTEDGGKLDVLGEDKENFPGFNSSFRMTGSPVKHNESAVGSMVGAQPQGQSAISRAGSMLGGKSTDSAQGGGIFGAATQAAGQLMDKYGLRGKEATQESLPPPNQVAESGSYAGTGERMLEMDSNPVGNQSIGRNTDVASQLFGSGQRASMLAMKGTPLQNAGHGEKQAHSHPSKTTTKMNPDGLYPGAKYVKGDLVDQDDLLDKTELDTHLATAVKSDKKGSFIKEKPDSGPGSDIDSAKGFGKKIRLNNMARSGYTANLKDKMDTNKFLFQKTPKK